MADLSLLIRHKLGVVEVASAEVKVGRIASNVGNLAIGLESVPIVGVAGDSVTDMVREIVMEEVTGMVVAREIVMVEVIVRDMEVVVLEAAMVMKEMVTAMVGVLIQTVTVVHVTVTAVEDLLEKMGTIIEIGLGLMIGKAVVDTAAVLDGTMLAVITTPMKSVIEFK